jgi:hypothetical protein
MENGTLLYVGGKPERLQMVDLFHRAGFVIDVLEAWRPNVDALIKWNDEKAILRNVVRGNIRSISNIPPEKYNVVMFWHGPEHVSREDLPFVLLNMESLATDFSICATPWGRYAQGEINGNPYERHISHLYELDFEGFGYRTATLGTKDKKGSNLLAWKGIR